MASVILSSVGSVLGAASGVPFGAQLGSIVGAGVGNELLGTSKHHFEGARLETLAVQTSTYGRMIPIVFGTVRIAGNMIWSLPLKEVASTTTTSTGGKGGVGTRSTSSSSTIYSYYATIAIAICEGEIASVNRVWADSQLLDLSQGVYRIYNGDETQLPDPLIESYQGVGSTPAYRGMAYVVIEDFPIGDFGNRIPNFTFEITRRTPQLDVDDAPVESLVKAIMLLPGSGEFVYDTQAEYKITGTSTVGGVVQSGYQVPLNVHTAQGEANVLVALDQLQDTFPNLEWVGVVVNWFGTSMDIGTCEIWPCVEYQANVETTPDDWSVAGFTRATGRQIGNDSGSLRYGGTPDDGSITRLLVELRRRGLKIFFYPQMLMDVAGKPWRGNLTGSATDIPNFFTKARGYNAFINHYASLVEGQVDAFAIGTEMRDLNAITPSAGVYPAVSQFVNLAAAVKAALGGSVIVTYAADWSEYHHTDGGWYNLDPLWASPSIDMVGIDAYFPLSDAVQTDYDVNALRAGWASGEGYDFYYVDEARTIKAPLDAPYAWKNISWWWNNPHVNPDGTTTAWTRASKPIWFTEYGYPSVDGCANEPNVFIDPTSGDSAYPRFSRGRVDFMAQRTAIAATEAEWLGSSMVLTKFLWTWDARPYPYWPDLLDVWSDGGNWVTGHWVQGKLGSSHVATAVEQIATRAGLTSAQVDTSSLQMLLDGFVISERVTARAALEQLMQAYFFSMKESNQSLIAMVRDSTVEATMNASDCIPQKAGNLMVPYVLTRQEDLVLPQRQEVQFLNRLELYETDIQSAQRSTQDATDVVTAKFSLVLAESHAQTIAETLLADAWSQRSSLSLQLPMAYAALEPGDVIQLVDNMITHRIRVMQVQIGHPGMLRISGVIDAADAWDGYIEPTVGSNGSLVLPNPKTRLEVLDIPALPVDTQDAMTLRFAACGISDGWKGASVVREMSSGDDSVLLALDKPSIIGSAVTALSAGTTEMFDERNTVDIALLGSGTLASADELTVLSGANVAVLGDEVIQFKNATQLSAGSYRLSGLLRGRLGTESTVGGHAIGERFVLLDDTVIPLVLPVSNNGQTWTLRAVTNGDSMTTGTESAFTISAETLKPLSPVDPTAIRNAGSGDITFSWVRRARIDGGLRDYVDVPLMEQSELYDVVVMSGGAAVRTWQVTSPSVVYSAAEQLADFGVAASGLTVTITQRSGVIGPGKPLMVTIPVH